jgi:hypothetical protein
MCLITNVVQIYLRIIFYYIYFKCELYNTLYLSYILHLLRVPNLKRILTNPTFLETDTHLIYS